MDKHESDKELRLTAHDAEAEKSEYHSTSESEGENDEMARQRNRNRRGQGGNAGFEGGEGLIGPSNLPGTATRGKGGLIGSIHATTRQEGGPVGSSDTATSAPEAMVDAEAEKKLMNARLAQLADLGNARAEHIRTVDKVRAKPIDGRALEATRAALRNDGGRMNAEKASALNIWAKMKEDDGSDDDGTAGQSHRAELNKRLHGIQGVEDLARFAARRGDSRSARGGRTTRGGRGGGFIGSQEARKQSLTANEDGKYSIPMKGRRGVVGQPSPLRAVTGGRGEPTARQRPTGRDAGLSQERSFLDVALSQQSRPQPAKKAMPTPQPPRPEPAWNLMSNDEFMAKVIASGATPSSKKPQAANVITGPERHSKTEDSPEPETERHIKTEESPGPNIKEESPKPKIEESVKEKDSPGPIIKEEPIEEPFRQDSPTKESGLDTPTFETFPHHVDEDHQPTVAEEFEGTFSEEEGSASTVQPPPPVAAQAQPDIDQLSSVIRRARDAATIGKELEHEEFVLKFFSQGNKDEEVSRQLEYTLEKIAQLKIELFDAIRQDQRFRSIYSEVAPSRIAPSQLATSDAPRPKGNLLSLSPEKISKQGHPPQSDDVRGGRIPGAGRAAPPTQGASTKDSMFAPTQPVQVGRGRTYTQEEMLELRGKKGVPVHPNKLPDRPITASEIVALGAVEGSKKVANTAAKAVETRKVTPPPPGFLNLPIKSRNFRGQRADFTRSISPKAPAPEKTVESHDEVSHPLKDVPASALPPHLRYQAQGSQGETKNTKVSKEDPQVALKKTGLVADMSTVQGSQEGHQSPKQEVDLTASTLPMEPRLKRNSEILQEEMGSVSFSPDVKQETPSYTVQSEAQTTVEVESVKPMEAEEFGQTAQPKPKVRLHAIPIVKPTQETRAKVGHAGNHGLQGPGLEGSIYGREMSEEERRREREMQQPVGHFFKGYNEKKKPNGHQIPAWLREEMEASKSDPVSNAGKENQKPNTILVDRDVSRGRKRNKNPFMF